MAADPIGPREVPPGNVILQICGEREDRFVHISRTELIQISGEADVAERARQVRARGAPVALTSDAYVEYVLVLDGTEDEASWTELLEEMARED